MRQNNHIINRHSYQDPSSFKIRQPINDNPYQTKQNLAQRYSSKDQQNRVTSKDHHKVTHPKDLKMTSMSNLYEKPQRLHTYGHDREEHSRELSYNSRGSNATRNSMKMSDYIALEAKSLLTNKDKFKYEGHSKYQGPFKPDQKFSRQELTKHDRQYKPETTKKQEGSYKHEAQYRYEGHFKQPLPQQSHMRSSSMHCYPSNFKVTRNANEKAYTYLNQKQSPSQPTQIPSFGIECRTSVSNQHDHKSFSLSKYPSNSYKLQEPSVSQRRQNISTEIDERIQRLRASSTSFQHKERLSQIKKIDEHKLENMDKINIKIKNILTTLENQEDYHKKKTVQKTNERIKTQSYAFFDPRKRQMTEEQEEESLLSKYTKNHETSQSRFSRFDLSRNDTFNNSCSNLMQEDFIQQKNYSKTALGKYCENNVSSYYYYEDDQAMMKSSQSPFKSSPDRSFKKHSVDRKDVSRSMSKNSKSSFDVASAKPVQMNESVKPSRSMKEQEMLSNYSYSTNKYAKNTGHMLTNIPQCETQIIESQAYDYTKNYSNGFVEAYHTFETKKSSIINKDFKTQSSYKDSYPQINNQKKSQIKQKSKLTDSYMPGSANKINAKETETHRFLNTKNLKDQLQKSYTIEEANKKPNLIYFKMQENQKYMKTSGKHPFNSTDKDFRSQNDAIDEITQFMEHNSSQIKSRNQKYQREKEIYTAKNPAYLSSYNQRKTSSQLNFEQKKKQFGYSDSIKQTPRMEIQKNQNSFANKVLDSHRTNNFNNVKTESEDQLDQKFKQYERKLQKYQKGMSASKILESQRSQIKSPNTERDLSCEIQNSNDKYSNESKSFRANSNFKPTSEAKNFERNNQISIAEQNMQKILSEIRRQRQESQIMQSKQVNCKEKKYQQKRGSESKHENQAKGVDMEKYCKFVSTPPNYSKRESHRFPKQDHDKFIQNLRKGREQIANLSQRKSKLNDLSPQNQRIQASNQRSESNTSKISSNTIVKGKNIDEEITKIQRKMQEYHQLKKDLNIESKINTQRTQNHPIQIMQFQYPKETYNEIKEEKKHGYQKFEDRNSYSENKQRNISFSSQKKTNDLLKIVTQQNSYVRVKNSIIKEQKNNEIKNYLDDQIERQSSRSKSPREKKEQYPKIGNFLSKQNLLPQTKSTIESPTYPGNKKIVLGLAQNLVLNSINDFNNIEHSEPGTKTDIKTPKLLKNLKSKLSQKCIVKKKAEKRGFRSQFINDLHEDNEVIKSAKKIELSELAQHDQIESTSRYSPENKQLLMKMLGLIENQIIMDEKLRNEKKMFNTLSKSDKWTILMSEYIRQNPTEKNVLLSQIVDLFTLSDEESNPFFSTRGVDFSLENMVRCYGECRDNWKNVLCQISMIPKDQLTTCGLNSKNLDIQRKGFISADDLTRFINMELNKYYRKRDLWLIWQRIAQANSIKKEPHSKFKLSLDQFMKGIGVSN